MKVQGHIIIRRKPRNGDNGQDAVLYELMPSAQVINFSNENVFSPGSVTCSVKKIQGSNLLMLSSTSALTAEKLQLSYTMDDGSNVDTAISPTTKVYPKNGITYISFLLKKDGVLIDKKTIQICNDGKDGMGLDGKPGYTYRPRGLFTQGNSYIYDDEYRDVVIHKFSGVAHVFRVRNRGTTITAVPTSIVGDSNWEAASELSFVATDFVLARQIHAEEIDGTNLEVIDGKFTGNIYTPYKVINQSNFFDFTVSSDEGSSYNSTVQLEKCGLNVQFDWWRQVTIVNGSSITTYNSYLLLPDDDKYLGCELNLLNMTSNKVSIGYSYFGASYSSTSGWTVAAITSGIRFFESVKLKLVKMQANMWGSNKPMNVWVKIE